MGITRFATRVHLSTRIAGEADTVAPAGMRLWVVDYTVVERGRESRFVTDHVAEAAARRMVANLLRDRLPGTEVSDVYIEWLN